MLENSDTKKRKIVIILNPAAGQDKPVLKLFNDVFQEMGVDWDILLTKEIGDGKRLAEEAVADGADVVAAYGGDGTIGEVSSGLIGSQVPLGILPGGTANILSFELAIPRNLRTACKLIACPNPRLRSVHLGRIGDRYFQQMVGIGLEANMVEAADREKKNRFGVMAYGIGAIQALRDPEVAHYRLLLDDQTVEIDGITCLVVNTGNIETISQVLKIEEHINQEAFEVAVVRRIDHATIFNLAASMTGGGNLLDILPHWPAKRVTVFSDPPQKVQYDGEVLGETPVEMEFIDSPVRVIVPSKMVK